VKNKKGLMTEVGRQKLEFFPTTYYK